MRKLLFYIIVIALNIKSGWAQEKTAASSEVKIFLDCNADCDLDYIKTEINYVNFVPDRFVSNIYVLITSQSTGSGGQEIKLFFSGRDQFTGIEDTLTFYRKSVDTDDEYRKSLVQYLKLGLVQYLAKTNLADKIRISVESIDSKPLNALENKKDKWNFWVFNASVNGFFNSDDFVKSVNVSGRINANRVTEKMKASISAYISKNNRKFSYNGIVTKITTDNSGLDATYVKSIGQRWSAGGTGSFEKSTYSNYDFQVLVNPAVEYSFYPYKEAVKKSVTLFYRIGPSYNNYIDSGYYDSPENYVLSQKLSLNINAVQKWGNISFNISWDNFLNSFYLNNAKISGFNVNTLSIGGEFEVRLFKGLSLSADIFSDFTKGVYPNIPRKLFSIDDLLTGSRQYPTAKNFFMFFRLNYRFGSIYNNVVNPRFDELF